MFHIETTFRSKQEFYKWFKTNIKIAPESVVNIGSLAVDSFLGGITYDGFWILKTGQLGSHGLQRYFCGRCFENGEKLLIEGRFRFPRRLVIWTIVIVGLFFVFLSPMLYTSGNYIPAILVPALIMGFVFCFCCFSGLESERDTILLLKRIANNGSGKETS